MTGRYSRRTFFNTTAGCIASTLLAPGRAFAADGTAGARPNIVFILADDMGWTGPACYGSDLHETPNIDRLAREGVRFTNAYSASPVCSPTRASIMTGQHPARLNITTWRESAVSRRENKGDDALASPITETDVALEYVTLAEMLREAGYGTVHIGKWHIGDAKHYPETQGFDVNIGGTLWGAPKTYRYPYRGMSSGDYRYVPHLEFGEEGEYLTDRLTTEAIAALEKIRHKPFFLHLAFHSPHTPVEGKPDLVQHYKQKITPESQHRNAEYAAMVHSLDENVGRVLAKLDEWGIADNTIVIFFSDNGGFDQVRNGQQVTNNAPLRSGKGALYEGGIRVPLIVKWPGVTSPGVTCDTPVMSTDFYPTLAEAVALGGSTALDGKNLEPLLDDPGRNLDRDTLCWHYPHYYFNTTPVSAIRHKDWKLLEYYEDNHIELYDLKNDLGETADLAKTHPDVAKDLQNRLHQWLKSVGAKLPERNE